MRIRTDFMQCCIYYNNVLYVLIKFECDEFSSFTKYLIEIVLTIYLMCIIGFIC